VIQSQSEQIVHETLSQKNPSQKMAGGVAQEDPEFKPQYSKKKKKYFMLINEILLSIIIKNLIIKS
jgi:hypothetical protein